MKKWIRILALLLIVVLVAQTRAFSESYAHHHGTVRQSDGQVVVGATITVFTAGTASLSIVYSDRTGTIGPNPTLTDANGDYDFYLVPGLYKIVITKVGFGTVTLDYESVGTQAHAATHQTGGSDPLSIATLPGSIDTTRITDNTITNADINATAGIFESKLSLNFPTHSNVNDPTANQKAALGGTAGAPSSSNKYVTDVDGRMINSRAPLAHAASHAAAGTDPITLTEAQITNLISDLAAKASLAHRVRHEDGGADEISVGGLSGTLADPQPFTVKVNGTSVASNRTAINLKNGINAFITGVDNSGTGTVDVTIDGPVATGAVAVQEASFTVVPTASILDFGGSGFDVINSGSGHASVVLDLTETDAALQSGRAGGQTLVGTTNSTPTEGLDEQGSSGSDGFVRLSAFPGSPELSVTTGGVNVGSVSNPDNVLRFFRGTDPGFNDAGILGGCSGIAIDYSNISHGPQRLFADKDCDGVKDVGEKYVDEGADWSLYGNGSSVAANPTIVDFLDPLSVASLGGGHYTITDSVSASTSGKAGGQTIPGGTSGPDQLLLKASTVANSARLALRGNGGLGPGDVWMAPAFDPLDTPTTGSIIMATWGGLFGMNISELGNEAMGGLQLEPQAAEPIACSGDTEGTLYQNSVDHKFYRCDGTSYGEVGSASSFPVVKESGTLVIASAATLNFRSGFDVSETLPTVANIDLDMSEVSTVPLLDGRTGGQTQYGGTAITDDYTLFANPISGASGAEVQLFGTSGGSTPGDIILSTGSPTNYLAVQYGGSIQGMIGSSSSSFTLLSHKFNLLNSSLVFGTLADSIIQMGSGNPVSATCIALTVDRLYGDLNCNNVKDAGESYFDASLAESTGMAGDSQVSNTLTVDSTGSVSGTAVNSGTVAAVRLGNVPTQTKTMTLVNPVAGAYGYVYIPNNVTSASVAGRTRGSLTPSCVVQVRDNGTPVASNLTATSTGATVSNSVAVLATHWVDYNVVSCSGTVTELDITWTYSVQ